MATTAGAYAVPGPGGASARPRGRRRGPRPGSTRGITRTAVLARVLPGRSRLLHLGRRPGRSPSGAAERGDPLGPAQGDVSGCSRRRACSSSPSPATRGSRRWPRRCADPERGIPRAIPSRWPRRRGVRRGRAWRLLLCPRRATCPTRRRRGGGMEAVRRRHQRSRWSGSVRRPPASVPCSPSSPASAAPRWRWHGSGDLPDRLARCAPPTGCRTTPRWSIGAGRSSGSCSSSTSAARWLLPCGVLVYYAVADARAFRGRPRSGGRRGP